MRDPKRIERIINLLYLRWKEFPDERFCQLLMNTLNKNGDPYYVEDTVLEQALKLEEEST